MPRPVPIAVALALLALFVLAPVASAQAGQPGAKMSANDPLYLPVTARARIGGVTVDLEVADELAEQVRGLMFRPPLADRRGMLFPFTPAQPVSFWMLNVPVSLDMVFIRNGRVRGVITAPPCPATPCPVYGLGPRPVDAVIELRAGHAAELGVAVGQRVRITQRR